MASSHIALLPRPRAHSVPIVLLRQVMIITMSHGRESWMQNFCQSKRWPMALTTSALLAMTLALPLLGDWSGPLMVFAFGLVADDSLQLVPLYFVRCGHGLSVEGAETSALDHDCIGSSHLFVGLSQKP